MPYNPSLPLDFATNHATLSEYLSYDITYETQHHNETPLAPSQNKDAVRFDAVDWIEAEQATEDGVSGNGASGGWEEYAGSERIAGLEANKNGSNQLTLF